MEKNNEVIQTHPLVGWDISISILEAGIAKIESGEYQENEYRRH
ncbi:hypothetical protein AB8Q33_00105 [Klebsiella pneumoniae]